MEILIMSYELKVDGRIAVTYLIRDGVNVKRVERLLPAGVDIVSYGAANVASLYADESAKDSGISVFHAVKEAQYRNVHIGALFAAFQQISLNGGIAEMVLAAKGAYQSSDSKLADVLAFETAYKAATDDQRKSLQALAIYALSALVGSG